MEYFVFNEHPKSEISKFVGAKQRARVLSFFFFSFLAFIMLKVYSWRNSHFAKSHPYELGCMRMRHCLPRKNPPRTTKEEGTMESMERAITRKTIVFN